MDNNFDIIIVGAGPAGLTTALKLAETGLRIAVFDKSTIPCDKVCGDALSGTVMNVLKRLPGTIYHDFLKLPGIAPSRGIRFYSPSGHFVDLPFKDEEDGTEPSPGYLCRRIYFDGFLASRLSVYSNIFLFPEQKITGFIQVQDGINVTSNSGSYQSKIVVGADGVPGMTARVLAGNIQDARKYCLGIRGYFRNVREDHAGNFIELHFLKEILPGYLWIFPMDGGITNVGLGILYSQVKKHEGSLAEKLNSLIRSNIMISERFKGAQLDGKLEAHGLALGPDNKVISGNRFLLVGDAASLVDPFTGEGIANAMISGEIAAEVISRAFQKNDFSGTFLSEYTRRIKARLFPELSTSQLIRKLAGSAFLFNKVVKKASENKEIRDKLMSMYSDEKARQELTKPGFYVKLFT